MQNILARIQFKIMKLTKIVVGYYILSILSGLCSILSINLSLLQKRWVEIEKRRLILTILLLDTKKRSFSSVSFSTEPILKDSTPPFDALS